MRRVLMVAVAAVRWIPARLIQTVSLLPSAEAVEILAAAAQAEAGNILDTRQLKSSGMFVFSRVCGSFKVIILPLIYHVWKQTLHHRHYKVL